MYERVHETSVKRQDKSPLSPCYYIIVCPQTQVGIYAYPDS